MRLTTLREGGVGDVRFASDSWSMPMLILPIFRYKSPRSKTRTFLHTIPHILRTPKNLYVSLYFHDLGLGTLYAGLGSYSGQSAILICIQLTSRTGLDSEARYVPPYIYYRNVLLVGASNDDLGVFLCIEHAGNSAGLCLYPDEPPMGMMTTMAT